MKAIRIWVSIGFSVLLATVVAAQSPGMGHGPHPGPGGPGHPGGPPDPVLGAAARILHHLDLAPDQRQQIHETLRGQVEGDLGRLARSFMEARHALEVRIWDAAATADAIQSAGAVVAERERALDEARHALALEVLGLLSDEQREAFGAMLAERPLPPPGPGHRGR